MADVLRATQRAGISFTHIHFLALSFLNLRPPRKHEHFDLESESGDCIIAGSNIWRPMYARVSERLGMSD